MGAPYSQPQMSQGGIAYPREMLYPSITIPMEIHITMPYPKATTIPHKLCIILGLKRWEHRKDPQVICHRLGPSQGHHTLCLFWQRWICRTCKKLQMTPPIITYCGCQSCIKY